MSDSLYWTSGSDESIRVAPLTGVVGGGTTAILVGSAQGVSLPTGLVLNPAGGRIYWANTGDDTIRSAPLAGLAGGGTADTLYGPAQGVVDPSGMAIDPVAGRMYWTEGTYPDLTIRRAPLVGVAGGGTVDPLYGSPGTNIPAAVAIDRVAGRIYWIDAADRTIRGAPLAGLAGGGMVDTLYGPSQETDGAVALAIDAAAGRIYWANYPRSTIWGAPIAGMAGGGQPRPLYGPGGDVSSPTALAIDPDPTDQAPERIDPGPARAATVAGWLGHSLDWIRDRIPSRPSSSPGRIYWSNAVSPSGVPANPFDKTIRVAPLGGGGPVVTLYGPVPGVTASALALLRAPRGTGLPVISWSLRLAEDPWGGLTFGGTHSGPLAQRLFCSAGSWAPDLPGSSLYRAPQSFDYRWMLNGTDIGGAAANAASYMPTMPGSYACRVTASNPAGSAAQTSAAATIA